METLHVALERIMMIQPVKKTLVLKQYEHQFSTVLQSSLQTGIKNINGRLRNAKD